MKQFKQGEVALHGEVMVTRASKIPSSAKKVNVAPGGSFIIADSETTGNHHVLDIPASGCEVFRDEEKGVTYMTSSVETTVRCVHPDRHDEMTLPPGSYEFGSQQEYDPFTARQRAVAD